MCARECFLFARSQVCDRGTDFRGILRATGREERSGRGDTTHAPEKRRLPPLACPVLMRRNRRTFQTIYPKKSRSVEAFLRSAAAVDPPRFQTYRMKLRMNEARGKSVLHHTHRIPHDTSDAHLVGVPPCLPTCLHDYRAAHPCRRSCRMRLQPEDVREGTRVRRTGGLSPSQP